LVARHQALFIWALTREITLHTYLESAEEVFERGIWYSPPAHWRVKMNFTVLESVVFQDSRIQIS
jgi:hypothetical protein